MNETKNILIGKIGKAIKVKNIHIETGGGPDLLLYSSMSRMCPEYNFYFIGTNELHLLNEQEYDKLFPNHNVFSAWTPEVRKKQDFSLITKYFEDRNIKVDFAIIFVGLVGNVNIPNFIEKVHGGGYCKPLMCFEGYCAPIIYTLNHIGCPLYTLAEDARYITINAKDLYNRERMIFTQIDQDFEVGLSKGHIKSETDHTLIKTKCRGKYAHMEKIFFMGLDENWKDKIDIDYKFSPENKEEPVIVLSNGCGTSKLNCSGNNSSRLPEYKKYIIDNFKGTPYENTKIYGSWDDEIYEQYPQIQKKMILELEKEIKGAKYMLVYSQTPGFVTAKPWEMIILGILPFLHPDYDCHNLLKFPEYLYLKDEKDFLNKINELEANPQKYKDLMKELQDMLKPEYFDGSFLINGIFGNIAKDLGFKYEFKKGVKPILNRYNGYKL